jgi:hypothetical protein
MSTLEENLPGPLGDLWKRKPKKKPAPTLHPALVKLHLRSSEAEVNAAMKAAGCASYEYAKDREFEKYVLRDIHTLEQAKAFIAMLNADCHALGYTHGCQKTWGLTSLARDVKKYHNLSLASHLSSCRRTHCGCHEVGSFALSGRYYEAVRERK